VRHIKSNFNDVYQKQAPLDKALTELVEKSGDEKVISPPLFIGI